jgi:hypothetical protein
MLAFNHLQSMQLKTIGMNFSMGLTSYLSCSQTWLNPPMDGC